MGDDWRGKPFYFEDYCVGESQLTESHTLTEQEIIDYARRWDPQPFHIDKAAADAMKANGTVLVPTLMAFKGISERLGQGVYTPVVENKVRAVADTAKVFMRRARGWG